MVKEIVDDEFSKQLSAMIREQRKKCYPKITQENLSHQLGVQPSTVNQIEMGKRRPSMQLLGRWLTIIKGELVIKNKNKIKSW